MGFSEHADGHAVANLIRNATFITPELMKEVTDTACRHLPSPGRATQTTRIKALVDARAWTDAALALIELELPSWQVRRMIYDAGEWYCAISRQRQLPDWLDQSIEVHHVDLALAILGALVEARIAVEPPSRPSVPAVPYIADASQISLCCENFA